MKRIQLSDRLIFQKAVLVLMFCIYIGILISSFDPLELIFILIFVLLGYRIFYLPDTIEFDADHMFIVYKDGETVVDLKDIYYISPTASILNPGGLGRIKFRFEGNEFTAQFLPGYFSSPFKKFKKYVTEKNPDVVIRSYSSSSFLDK